MERAMHGKPSASLSSSLLARKGHAKPAMRPQGFVSLTPNGQDDLGWNDMGDDYPTQVRPTLEPVEPVAPPTVLVQRAELAEQIAPKPAPIVEPVLEEPEPEPEPVAELAPEPVTPEPFVQAEPVEAPLPVAAPAPEPVKKAPKAKAKIRKSKAAFTLRLDAERHLRLRLASAVSNRSAQQIVTEALDAFLDSLTEIDALACQLAARGGN